MYDVQPTRRGCCGNAQSETYMTTSTGLFWAEATDALKKKRSVTKKAKPAKEAPEPFWLAPDYLPGLEDALALKGVKRLTAADWAALAKMPDVELVWDTECYHDYFAFGVRVRRGGEYVNYTDWIELDEDTPVFDRAKALWIIRTFTMKGFNSYRYDAPMLSLVCAGCDNEVLKIASDDMIARKVPHYKILQQYRVAMLKFHNHVDLQTVPKNPKRRTGLKEFAARLGAPTLQDLPFPPEVVLGRERRAIVRHYLNNDGTLTQILADNLDEDCQLRANMSKLYGLNLYSDSGPTIAEKVLCEMYRRKAGVNPFTPIIPAGTAYTYNAPSYLRFRSPVMHEVFEAVKATTFIVSEKGSIELPDEVSREIPIGGSVYQMGIGGLHSTEKRQAHVIDDDEEMVDADVASFYPQVIINQQLYPKHLGPLLLETYSEIKATRLKAKADGEKVVADSLKLVLNSSFGHFGNKYSNLYAPDFLIQVTLSGQLSLLMMIDELEHHGISVVSANTDGIVVRCAKSKVAKRDEIFAWWQETCGFELEYANYVTLASASVNSYFAIAVDKDGKKKAKRKGMYAKESIDTTPSANICADAVEQYLLHGTPVEDHIRGCKNLLKFVLAQKVDGGGLWKDWYLGKTCRWYWSNAADADRMVYAKSGNSVPRANQCRPVPVLPDQFPDDVCIDTYIQRAYAILAEIGITQENPNDDRKNQYEENLSLAQEQKREIGALW
jgi:hypothetical protein